MIILGYIHFAEIVASFFMTEYKHAPHIPLLCAAQTPRLVPSLDTMTAAATSIDSQVPSAPGVLLAGS